jgi:hypothetical protein
MSPIEIKSGGGKECQEVVKNPRLEPPPLVVGVRTHHYI